MVPLLVLTWINVKGIKQGALTAVVLAWGKVLPLVLFVAVGVFWVYWGRIFPVPMPERGNFMKAALLVLFAYGGFENTSAPAGEFKNPKRDVPFALIVQIAIVATIYTRRAARRDRDDAEPRRLADAARRRRGPDDGPDRGADPDARRDALGPRHQQQHGPGGPAVSLRARARRDGSRGSSPGPSALSHTARRDPDPDGRRAAADFTGTAEELAVLSAIARLATYMGTVLSVPVLRRKMRRRARVPSPGRATTIPIVAFAICLLFLSAAEKKNWIGGGIALAVGAVIYLSRRGAPPVAGRDNKE